MTPLDKAEAVLAAFCDVMECPRCGIERHRGWFNAVDGPCTFCRADEAIKLSFEVFEATQHSINARLAFLEQWLADDTAR